MFVKTLVATLCVIGVALAEQSPVFIWGANSPTKPSLQTVPQNEFSELISELLSDHMVVAFQEHGLTANDFLCANSETSMSCYAHLQSVESKNYYASVENPGEAIRAAASEREFNTIAKNGELETPIECSAGKAVFVNFEETNQLRSEQLAAHDNAIATIAKSVSCPTVFLYMPSPSSVPQKRQRRVAISPNGYYYREGANFLIYFLSFFYNNGETAQEVTFTDALTIVNATGGNQFSVTLTTTDAKTLTFDIVYSTTDGYYSMTNVMYDGSPYLSNGVNAPRTFSYYCGNLTLPGGGYTPNTPNTKSLLWNGLQFQAPFGAVTNTSFAFGDPWHCVGFFTPGILSGLFVVIIMLAIVFTGVCWMMDINTMDRFDDPKGKTITINASD